MINKGCVAYLACDVDTTIEQKSKPMVNEFLDVFPEDLPGLPLDKEIEFVIDLLLGTAPSLQFLKLHTEWRHLN